MTKKIQSSVSNKKAALQLKIEKTKGKSAPATRKSQPPTTKAFMKSRNSKDISKSATKNVVAKRKATSENQELVKNPIKKPILAKLNSKAPNTPVKLVSAKRSDSEAKGKT